MSTYDIVTVTRLTEENKKLREALERIRDRPSLSVGGGECPPDCGHANHIAERALSAPAVPIARPSTPGSTP